MRSGYVPVHGQVLVQEGQQLQASGGVAPIAHEIHDDGEEPLQDDAGVLHSAVRVVGEAFGEGAAGFGVGEDGVAFGAEGEGEEFRAWVHVSVGVLGRRGGRELYVQTSVVMPARMIWVLFAATTAALKSELSHASTSPFRLMSGASGNRSKSSFGRGPLGPVWALVVRTIGMSNALAIEAWAMMLLRKTVGS